MSPNFSWSSIVKGISPVVILSDCMHLYNVENLTGFTSNVLVALSQNLSSNVFKCSVRNLKCFKYFEISWWLTSNVFQSFEMFKCFDRKLTGGCIWRLRAFRTLFLQASRSSRLFSKTWSWSSSWCWLSWWPWSSWSSSWCWRWRWRHPND